MHRTLISTAALAALGMGALAVPAARAQTQDLFASNIEADTISRFAGTGPGTLSTTPTTLSAPSLSGPTGLAFDAKGDLFAANLSSGGGSGPGTITEFAAGAAPGTFGAATTLVSGLSFPDPLTVDSRGNLFAGVTGSGNGSTGSVLEFALNPVTGAYGAGTTLASGLNQPDGLAVDSRGNLFETNAGGGTILEFALNPVTGAYGAGTTFASGLSNYPGSLAFDAQGDLFVADQGHGHNDGAISEFAFNSAAGTYGAGTTFASGLAQPVGLAADARGDLFVNDFHTGTISEYLATGPGTFGSAQNVETGQPGGSEYLAFGPSAPPVPEASQAVSLGLLLALGAGGVVMARKKKGKA